MHKSRLLTVLFVLTFILFSAKLVAAESYNTEDETSYDVSGLDSEDDVVEEAEVNKHQFELSSEVYSYKYTESIGVENKGWKYGLAGKYTYRLDDHTFGEEWNDSLFNVVRAELRGSYGEVDYEGTGTVNNIPDYNVEGRLTLGYDVPLKENITLMPFAGIGYRYLFNNFSVAPATPGVYSGYDRESRYVYIPLGAEAQIAMSQGWSVLLTGEFDFFASGTQVSHFEDMHDTSGANGGYSKMENEQKHGYGWRAAVRLQKATERFDLFTESFFRFWHIEDSEFEPFVINGVTQCSGGLCTGGIEPDNKTWEVGVNLGAKF